MTKLGKTLRQDRSRAVKYETVARALHRTARDLETLGEAKHGNGLAIVAIHAAIAYVDALTVAYREIRSTDGDHRRAADVLQHALGTRSEQDQIRRLRGMLEAKSHASYSGTFYTLDDARKLMLELSRFAAWADEMLARRPI